MTTRRRNVLVLALVLALSAAGAYWLAPAASERPAIEAVPKGAFLVATIDLVKLRASPLARDLGSLREVSDVAELCGFDPLAHARTIAIAVPEKPDGVFGLAINNDLDRDALSHCAERVMSARSAMPSITQHGSWTVLEQRGLISEATRPQIAYRDGAPLLVARGDYLATMQAALDGETPRAIREGGHAALRKRAPSDAFFVATALLPQSVRDRIKDEMTDETASTAVGANAPDQVERQKKTMSAILSVTAVALSVTSRGDMLDVSAELDCENEDACGALRDFIDRKRKSIASEPAARFAGIAGLLDALRLETKGPSIDLSLSAPESEIVRATKAALSSAFTRKAGASGFSPRR